MGDNGGKPNFAYFKTALRRLQWDDWVIWFGMGGYCLLTAFQTGYWLLWLGAILLLFTGLAKLTAQTWAWHLALVVFALVALGFAVRLGQAVTAWRILLFAMAGYGIWNHWKTREEWRPTVEDKSPADAPPPVSLVFWLKEPRYLDTAMVNQAAERAFGRPFGKEDDDECFVAGDGPTFVIRMPDTWLMLHNFPRNYFDDPELVAEKLREMRRAQYVRQHAAWLSVDMLAIGPPTEREAVMARLGVMLAELADDNVLAIYHPGSNRLTPWEPAMKAVLAGGKPLQLFDEQSFVPVLKVAGDDATMATAVAEARRRWPEFVSAFHASQNGSPFSIKAPVTENGHTEFIWIEVKSISAGQVHGLLANEPVNLGALKIGDFVSVPEAHVNDWCYQGAPDGLPVGLFTVKAVIGKKR